LATLFISDLHLCTERPHIQRLFLRFLAGPARAATALYILGDLFEYWIGDDDLDDPFNAETAAALRRLAQSGTAVFFMAGNRDIHVGEAFAVSAGLTLLAEPSVADVAGTPTLLLHGDTLCTDDAAYLRFREEVRSERWRHDMLALPLAERRRRIGALRRESESQKTVKPMDIMDVNPAAVAAALRSHGCARLIHGHTHRPAHHLHEVDGRRCERWVLPAWFESGAYLACAEEGCRSVAFS
jgi:UDP-2,3-diacylglucosamine hydrolase